MPSARRAALAAGLALSLAAPAGALAQIAPDKPTNPFCLAGSKQTAEAYGPTDIGATVGNQRLSVGVNPQGTLSVLRWPSPSYYDQLRYFTVDRALPRLGLQPNEGAFSGLRVRLRDGRRETLWLRDLASRQYYAGEDSDTVVTRFRSRRHRLLLELDDVVPQSADVLMRRHVLRLGRRSPVRAVRLISFANLNPTASKTRFIPTEDWCAEVDGTDVARYVPTADAIVYEIAETDQSLLQRRSVAVAMGASRLTSAHHVGADRYTGHRSTSGGPESAYDDAGDGLLSGNGALGPAEVDAAISMPLTRRRPVTVTLAAGPDSRSALALLERYRRRSPVREARAKRRSYLRWLRRARLPRRAPRSVRRLSKRALISLRQATDEHAGRGGDKVAIVASIATQSPYGEDWIRDGAFFNEALADIGHPELVERHNYFYAEVQHTLEEGAPPGSPLTICQQPTPDGNWVINNYADGPEGGPIPWEIDEAGFGLWTLWRHYERAPGARRAYLERIYPTIRRTAEFLVAYRDPLTGLTPSTACEDDHPTPQGPQPTMHGSGPVLLAMRSAAAAAEALGRGADARRYRARAAELEAAIDRRHRAEGGAWTTDFGVGGWALWPVRVKPSYADQRMRAQAEAVWKGVAPAFDAPHGPRKRGQYEAKALHGLAFFHRAVDPGGLSQVKRGLRWIAGVQAAAQGTGILGEIWYVHDGRLLSVISQPHVWEQVLFHLAAVKAYGGRRYKAGRPERLLGPQRRKRRR
jgi:hypothetical protein